MLNSFAGGFQLNNMLGELDVIGTEARGAGERLPSVHSAEPVVEHHRRGEQHARRVDDTVAGEMYLPGATIKLSKTPARVGAVPTPGQHTDEVLGGLLGYDAAAIAALRGAGAIA